MATLFFNTEGDTIKYFLNSGNKLNVFVALTFMLVWFFFTSTTYGCAIPAGLFFPGLLIGASLGQFVGRALISFGLLASDSNDITTYAVVGGVAILAGYCRLSFCLAVLLMETTQDVNLFIPMLLGVIFAKGIGDLLDKSLYKQAINLKGIPMISGKMSRRAQDYNCSEVMITEVVSINHSETLKSVYQKLSNCTHNGFPVINENRKVIGLISRNHLVTIIEHGFY
jgi:H+/Cl- antiporter ClcA